MFQNRAFDRVFVVVKTDVSVGRIDLEGRQISLRYEVPFTPVGFLLRHPSG
jgi:hypothetical protein